MEEYNSYDAREIRKIIGNVPIITKGNTPKDNIFTVLETHFERHPDHPGDNAINDELGWNRWAADKANDILDRIAEELFMYKELIMSERETMEKAERKQNNEG